MTFPTSGLSGTIDALTNGVNIQYTYTYDESPIGTPEPLTMVLAGSGLLGLALARKSRAR